MQINSDLRLVLPLRTTETGDVLAWAYHTPISTQTYEANYRVLAATKAALLPRGMDFAAVQVGASIAALRLRDEARRDALERGDVRPDGEPNDSGAVALLADLQRLTMVAIPTPAGWENVPVSVAIQRGAIDQDEWREVESPIVFFTCIFHLTRRAQRARIAGMVASVMQGSITSLSLTEWTASLAQSTTDGTSVPAAAA